MPDDTDFLTRWSRRKAAARRAEDPEGDEIVAAAEPEAIAEPAPVEVPELPDPATLDIGSDFKAFMAENVPGDLRRQALRRLWRVNPIINSLDGLDDYYVTQDFTDAATVVPDLRTLYRVGKGMLDAVVRPDEAPGDADGQPEPALTQIESDPQAEVLEVAVADDAAVPVATGSPT